MYKWYYREKKIFLIEIYKITKARYNTEDLNYKKILKYYLPVAYKEFKDIFSKKQNNTLLLPRNYNH